MRWAENALLKPMVVVALAEPGKDVRCTTKGEMGSVPVTAEALFSEAKTPKVDALSASKAYWLLLEQSDVGTTGPTTWQVLATVCTAIDSVDICRSAAQALLLNMAVSAAAAKQ